LAAVQRGRERLQTGQSGKSPTVSQKSERI
jgi:hypothetical protein